MKTEQDLLNELERIGIDYIRHEHPPVFTVDEAEQHSQGIEGAHCKNLFFRDRKKQGILVVTLARKPLRIKEVGAAINAKGLSFARPERLMETLGVIPGSVTPFAVINVRIPGHQGAENRGKGIRVVLDQDLMAEEQANFHPLVNTATLTIQTGDLIRFMAHCGQTVEIVQL